MCSSCPISGTVCYLECRHGFQSNGGVNVLQCGKNGKWNQNVSSTLQCKGTSFLWLFRLFEAKQKMEQCCFSKIRCLGRSCSPLAMNLTECTSVQVVWCDSIKGSFSHMLSCRRCSSRIHELPFRYSRQYQRKFVGIGKLDVSCRYWQQQPGTADHCITSWSNFTLHDLHLYRHCLHCNWCEWKQGWVLISSLFGRSENNP